LITTDQGTVPEFLEDRQNARIVPRRLESLQAAVLELRDHPELRIEYGKRARQAVLQGGWDWGAKIKDYDTFFQKALGDQSARRPNNPDFNRILMSNPARYLSIVQDQWRLESELRVHLSDSIQALQDSQVAQYLERIQGQEIYISELESERQHLHRYIGELEGHLDALNENSLIIRALKKLGLIKTPSPSV
jgi:hypothetical protein